MIVNEATFNRYIKREYSFLFPYVYLYNYFEGWKEGRSKNEPLDDEVFVVSVVQTTRQDVNSISVFSNKKLYLPSTNWQQSISNNWLPALLRAIKVVLFRFVFLRQILGNFRYL